MTQHSILTKSSPETQPVETTPQPGAGSSSAGWSGPTLVGSAVAAASATLLSSRLGLIGTIVGAVLVSVVSTVLTGTLTGWLERLRALPGAGRRPGPSPAIGRIGALVTGAGAVVLVVLAWRTGTHLLLDDLPRDSFAARFVAQFR